MESGHAVDSSSADLPEGVEGEVYQPPLADNDFDCRSHSISQRIPGPRHLVVVPLNRYTGFVYRQLCLRGRLGCGRDVFERAVDDTVSLVREGVELQLHRQAFTQKGAVGLRDFDLHDRTGFAGCDTTQGGVRLDFVTRLRGGQIRDDTGDRGQDLEEVVLVYILEANASRGIGFDSRGVELQ